MTIEINIPLSANLQLQKWNHLDDWSIDQILVHLQNDDEFRDYAHFELLEILFDLDDYD